MFPSGLPRCADCDTTWRGLLRDRARADAPPSRRLLVESYADNATWGHSTLRGMRWWWPDGDGGGSEGYSASDHTWVEVMRKQWDREGREMQAAWFFVTPGSDVWLNTGRALRLDTWHGAGWPTPSSEALEETWRVARNLSAEAAQRQKRAFGYRLWSMSERTTGRAYLGETIVPMARELGFDTILIRRAIGDNNATMLLHLRGRPTSSVCGDGLELRTQMATRPCVCVDAATLNCDGGEPRLGAV